MIRCSLVVISFMEPVVNCMYLTFRLTMNTEGWITLHNACNVHVFFSKWGINHLSKKFYLMISPFSSHISETYICCDRPSWDFFNEEFNLKK